MPTRLIAAALLLLAATPASANQVCAWMVESIDGDKLHDFRLWLQADADVDILYQMAGEGVLSEGSRSHSPGSASFSLRAGEPGRAWGFATDYNAPGTIDIIAEIHAPPADIFSDEPSPLLASFTFHRDIPADEKAPPATFLTKQCAAIAPAAAPTSATPLAAPPGDR